MSIEQKLQAFSARPFVMPASPPITVPSTSNVVNICTNKLDTVPVTVADDSGLSVKKTSAVHAMFASGTSPSNLPMYHYYMCLAINC